VAPVRPFKLIPSPLLRRVDRVREQRIMAVATPASREFVDRYGLQVRHGPFTGMSYLEGLEPTVGDLVGKLTGVYERELHGAVAEWIEAGLEHVIDVGSAEGYYAVGFAHTMPAATVHAFDINPDARRVCAAMAELNGVGERVKMQGECAPASLGQFPERGVALLSDCEGGERVLLDPELAPRLRGWPILVELHDFIDPSITETICSRFRASHEIEMIEMEDREQLPEEFEFFTPRQRAVLLSERPAGMRWAHMRPR
jgi:hypothetical protein